jgi:CRP-like cAMP-binding protein
MSENRFRDNPNFILARLPPDEFQYLSPGLEAVDLPLRTVLEPRGKPIAHVYFMSAGFASIVANGEGRRSIEVGMIGREGTTGTAIVMGSDRSPHETFIQAAGGGFRMTVAKLRQGIDEAPNFRRMLLQFAYVMGVQSGQTALANGRASIEERLSRWLLMAHDRIGSNELPLTHEFLAVMLGVRRPGVTVALNLLENRGLIRAVRGVIVIVDREGLEEGANGTYGTPEAEYRRLFP